MESAAPAAAAPPRLRLLSLHGMGTSAAILARQLRPLADATSDIAELVYLDGQELCPAADPVIEKVFPGGPYRRYMKRARNAVPPIEGVTCGDAYESIDDAIAHCVAAVSELGPFDGVLGFSQGANLATILAAHLFANGPAAAHPRFALLFCGTQFGWAAQLPQLFPQQRVGADDDTLAAPCVEEILRVPSFHVFGAQDPFKPTSEVLSRLWAAPLRTAVTHPAGHRPLPPGRDAEAVVSAARAFLLQMQVQLRAATPALASAAPAE